MKNAQGLQTLGVEAIDCVIMPTDSKPPLAISRR